MILAKTIRAGRSSAGPATSSTGTNLALVRFVAGGLLDTSFGTGGIVTTQFDSPINVRGPKPIDLALDVGPLDPSAGKIVVVTELQSSPYQYVVVRYNAIGSLDTSFAGGAGYEMLSNLNGVTPSVAIESSGDIIVVGNNTTSGNIVELDSLDPNGTFNTAFGSGGIVVLSPPANTTYGAHDVAIQSNGQIVVAGNSVIGTNANFLVARFNSTNGSLDASFGAGGVAVSSGMQAAGWGVAFESDGRIVVDGTLPGDGGFALARFLSTVPQITSFSASPNTVAAGSSLTLTASNIIDTTSNSSITQVAFYVDSNGDGVLDSGDTLLGYGIQSSPGVWTYTFTVNLTSGTYTLFAQAQDSFGVFGDPAFTTLQVI